MLLTKTVKVKIMNRNVDTYRNKGYDCKIGEILELPVMYVSEHSRERVSLLCDECGRHTKDVSIDNLNKIYKNGNYVCGECYKKILNERKCEVCGSTDGVSNYLNQGKLLCRRHQKILREHGDIVRTVADKNEIRIYQDYLEFDTYDKKGNVNGTYKADLDMKEFIENNKIHKHSRNEYACYKLKGEDGKTKNISFHRYVMGIHLEEDKKIIVDHISRDKKDNRKKNLRIATHKDNVVNTGMFSTNTSGHKGISWEKRNSKWEVYIHKNNKKISLGLYSDFDTAVKVREIAEIIYFGKNNPNYENLINKYINEPQVQQLLKGE